MKISVLTPSYNDAISIKKTLDSLLMQTYTDWESIIIDDGSTDDTRKIIEEYKKEKGLEDKIKYIYQENKDQLNAILNGLQYVNGDYIFTLHSDDLLPDKDFFSKCVEFMNKNQEYDAITGDLIIIDENDNVTNCWKANEYVKDEITPVKLILTKGANIYGDVFFHRKKTYVNQVKENYLNWNTPMWLDLNDKVEMLNIKKVDFPMLKYRIHSQNYANNEIGKFNLLNGELRTLTRVMKFYEVDNFEKESKIYNFYRKPIIRKLKLYLNFKPKYHPKETENKYELVKSAIYSVYGKEYEKNIFLRAVLGFYQKHSDRVINLNSIKNTEIYKGKDIRIFTKKLLDNKLSEFYILFMSEMEKGFSKIMVDTDEEVEKVKDLLKFMCIYPYVEVEKNK
jgi:glycosyltransferase involved in cell wall biosynthesis